MAILRKSSEQSHAVRPRGRWRRGLVALAAVLPVVSVLAVTSPASAHANVVTGVAACQVDGTYTVTWTVANDFNSPVATSLASSTGGGTITGLPVTIGVSPAKATVTQSGVAGSTKSASLSVKGVWGDNFSTTNTGSIKLDGKCAPQHTPVTLCHATDSNSNPYVKVTVDDDAVVNEGHGSHTGPIWNPNLKANHVKWGDIIPAFTYYDTHGTLQHYAGLNIPAGNAVLSADCTFQIAIPAKPVPTPPTCSADGSLTLVNGDHYTWSDTKLPGVVGTHTVTATADEGFVFTNGKTTVTYTVVVEGATNDCAVQLVAPTVTQPICTGPGTSDPGQITLPADTADVTYSLNGNVVTATTHVPNKFSATTGWVIAGNGLTATYTVTFTPAGDCLVEVAPVAPEVVQSVCNGPGTSTDPTVTPATTVGITYSVNGNVVTATPDKGYVLDVAAPWVLDEETGTATYTVTFTSPGNCLVEVAPVAPEVVQSVCSGPGTATVPTVTPATTEGITYTVNVNVVTATPDKGYVLDVTAPWVLDEETGTATYTVTFTDPGACLTTVTPVAPTVDQAVCTGPGTSTTPVITPATTEHITYAVNGNVVTATPDKGYELAAADGWTIDPETGVGTYTVTLVTPDCTVVVTIVDPTITTSEQCGVAPTFTIPATEGITYLLDGEPIDAGTYSSPTTGTITAQAQKGYALSNSEWSFTVNLPATVACPTVVTPVDPTVDPSSECGVEGTYVIPSTEGIDYLLDGVVVAAGSHDGPASGTVTARAQEGFTLANAEWSYSLELPAAETCELPNTGGKTPNTSLPQTGAQTAGIVGAGAAALLAGLVLVVVGRRRQDEIG